MKYQLTKSCPDGRILNIKFDTQHELMEHLTAMFKHTTGYDIVAIIQIP